MKAIVFTPRAAKEFDALPFMAKAAIEAGLTRYAVEGYGDVKRLKGQEGFRLRIGEHRVIFEQDQTKILVFTMSRRKTTTYR